LEYFEGKEKNLYQRVGSILSDTGEASDDENTGNSENLVKTGFVGTQQKLIRMWTE
jgi:hypothetical protein